MAGHNGVIRLAPFGFDGVMSEWQIPANLMSMTTSCGPGSRRSMVVLVSGAVAEVAAYAETVLMKYPSLISIASSRSLAKVMFSGHLPGGAPKPAYDG